MAEVRGDRECYVAKQLLAKSKGKIQGRGLAMPLLSANLCDSGLNMLYNHSLPVSLSLYRSLFCSSLCHVLRDHKTINLVV